MIIIKTSNWKRMYRLSCGCGCEFAAEEKERAMTLKMPDNSVFYYFNCPECGCELKISSTDCLTDSEANEIIKLYGGREINDRTEDDAM